MKKCDVIIPIYNAYEALMECVDSVIKNTDLNSNRLILINDCSTDSNISKYLKKLKKDNGKINLVVLDNEKNLGFVGTVNKGMKYSDNDVLLLNSDTVVGKCWLDKIKECAYSMEKVATVTPLSNNATLVSVPKGLQRNEVPTDVTIDEYNEMIDKCSYHDYPEIPTAHGFCMYIRREVLDLVGLFDEKTFGRGYGEENDFSFRCVDYGYRNLLCDDVIVYHKESQSFSSERSKVIEEHLKKIENRYPEYKGYLDSWCVRFPISYICKNIDYYTKLQKKKNILVLIHDWMTSTGGTTLHVKDLVNNLKDKYNFHILFPNDGGYILKSYFEDSENQIYFPVIDKMTKFNRYNQKYKVMLTEIVKACSIDSVHIHHMIGHYFDVADVCLENNINSIITLHDFYCLCPTVNMLYCGDKYCDDMKNKDCSKCLAVTKKIDNDIIPNWRSDWYVFLKKINRIIVPSLDTKNRILAVYKELNIVDIEHGIDIIKSDYKISYEGEFNIAFIGVMCNHKGGNILKKLIDSNIDKKFKFHVFGSSELDDLTKSRGNYIYHGRYDRDNLSNLLISNNIHLICFFQIWPETYSYTLNEAVATGIPVLSFDIGAGAERVKKYNLGWIIDMNSSIKEIEEKLESIYANRDEYLDKVDGIADYKIKTTKEMALEYVGFYDSGSKKDIDAEVLRKIIKNENVSNIGNCNEQLNAILNSTKWKLINKIKFPPKFVAFVRKIIARRRK